jgi:hypothetical protein
MLVDEFLLQIQSDSFRSEAAHLGLDDQYIWASFRAHQMVRLIDFASTELHIVFCARSVVLAFKVDHSAVMRIKSEDLNITQRDDNTTNFRTIMNGKGLIRLHTKLQI